MKSIDSKDRNLNHEERTIVSTIIPLPISWQDTMTYLKQNNTTKSSKNGHFSENFK
jgi:hypothetical protein